MLLSRLEYYDKALDDYNAALFYADDKDIKVMIFVNRGDIKRKLQQPEEDVNDLKKALQLDSANLGILANL